MKKTLLTLLAIAITLGFTSCSDSKKFKEATDVLSMSFTSLGKFPLQDLGLKPESMALEDKEVVIKVSLADSIVPIANYNFDNWIKPCIIKSVLGGSINALALGKKLGTDKGGSPAKEYIQLMRDEHVKFKVVLNSVDGEHNYTITPGEALSTFDMSDEDYRKCEILAAFLPQVKLFKSNKIAKDVTIEGGECRIVLNDNVDRKLFMSELNKMPVIIAYAKINGLKLKVNDILVPDDQMEEYWKEAQKLMNAPKDGTSSSDKA